MSDVVIGGISAAAAVIILVALVVAVVCAVPSIKARVFPHRGRLIFKPYKSNERF